MNPIFASDLKLMLADAAGMASPVTFGAITAMGILGVASETFTTASNLSVIQGETWTLIFATEDLTGLVSGSVTSTEGHTFMVRHIDRMADGLHSKAFMELIS